MIWGLGAVIWGLVIVGFGVTWNALGVLLGYLLWDVLGAIIRACLVRGGLVGVRGRWGLPLRHLGPRLGPTRPTSYLLQVFVNRRTFHVFGEVLTIPNRHLGLSFPITRLVGALYVSGELVIIRGHTPIAVIIDILVDWLVFAWGVVVVCYACSGAVGMLRGAA